MSKNRQMTLPECPLSWLPAIGWSHCVAAAIGALIFSGWHSFGWALGIAAVSAGGAVWGFTGPLAAIPQRVGKAFDKMGDAGGGCCPDLDEGCLWLLVGIVAVVLLIVIGWACGWLGRQFSDGVELSRPGAVPTSLWPRQFSILEVLVFTTLVAGTVFFTRFVAHSGLEWLAFVAGIGGAQLVAIAIATGTPTSRVGKTTTN